MHNYETTTSPYPSTNPYQHTGAPTNPAPATACEHSFAFMGIVYWDGAWDTASQAHRRMYGDKFYCSKCLQQQTTNVRERGMSFDPLVPGATPK